tara:strand:- start:1584 stop:2081 length:498 start_codon:yes stop_codon:yes gene_type:complete
VKVPYTNFKTLIDSEWKELDTVDIFADKKIVVFSVPGAYLPNTAEQVQEYDQRYEGFKEAGINEVYCISVNDSAVMNSWFESIKLKNVKPLGDGDGIFTQGTGMLVNKPKQGLGLRSWRYSMLVDNGEIIKKFVEDGQNNSSDDDDPFEVSNAKTILDFIKSNEG